MYSLLRPSNPGTGLASQAIFPPEKGEDNTFLELCQLLKLEWFGWAQDCVRVRASSLSDKQDMSFCFKLTSIRGLRKLKRETDHDGREQHDPSWSITLTLPVLSVHSVWPRAKGGLARGSLGEDSSGRGEAVMEVSLVSGKN